MSLLRNQKVLTASQIDLSLLHRVMLIFSCAFAVLVQVLCAKANTEIAIFILRIFAFRIYCIFTTVCFVFVLALYT